MAEPENSLFDIEVDADDYADAAAEDTPVVDRTHQSEADFLKVKETYQARQDGSRGSLYSELLEAVPSLAVDAGIPSGDDATKKVKLDKRSRVPRHCGHHVAARRNLLKLIRRFRDVRAAAAVASVQKQAKCC